MALLNFTLREITVTIVYFGPSGAGTTTNLMQLPECLSALEKGQLLSFGSRDAGLASHFFSFVSPDSEMVPGFRVRLRSYSLSGGVTHPEHRNEVLQGADAIVFVADARRNRAHENVETLFELERHLAAVERHLPGLPTVFQVNHLGADRALPAAQVAYDLNPYGFPVIEAHAPTGEGVAETMEALLEQVALRVKDKLIGRDSSFILEEVSHLHPKTDEEVIAAHVSAIERANRATDSGPIDIGGTDGSLQPLATDWFDVEVAFQPQEFVGFQPVYLKSTELDGDRIRIEMVMERLNGMETRGLRVILANRPTDAPILPRQITATAPPLNPRENVAASLPDTIDLDPPEVVSGSDTNAVIYGIIGVLGGLIIGVLVSFLLFI